MTIGARRGSADMWRRARPNEASYEDHCCGSELFVPGMATPDVQVHLRNVTDVGVCHFATYFSPECFRLRRLTILPHSLSL
jgi:hypothetical protein